ncbi:hypothetical protein ACIBL3_45520 [Kribbella sp. NPDC050124]|uniref:hypothetical protein n=1 Tax=Kribbella sp. NPDC050124 TaxID=3364114 RepID=UPI00379231F8
MRISCRRQRYAERASNEPPVGPSSLACRVGVLRPVPRGGRLVVDRRPARAILETLTGVRRAGADTILTYWAADAVHPLNPR